MWDKALFSVFHIRVHIHFKMFFLTPQFKVATPPAFTSVKGQRVNILGFAVHMVPVAATELCHCSMKSATDNM